MNFKSVIIVLLVLFSFTELKAKELDSLKQFYLCNIILTYGLEHGDTSEQKMLKTYLKSIKSESIIPYGQCDWEEFEKMLNKKDALVKSRKNISKPLLELLNSEELITTENLDSIIGNLAWIDKENGKLREQLEPIVSKTSNALLNLEDDKQKTSIIENAEEIDDLSEIHDEHEKASFNFWSFKINIFSVLLILLLGFTLFYILKLKNQLNYITEGKKYHKKNSESFDNQNRLLQHEITKLKGDLESKKEELKMLQSNISSQVEESSFPKDPLIPEKSESPITFYLPSPNSDGQFSRDNISSTKLPSISLYRLEIDKNNPKKAKVFFDSDDKGIKRALNTPDFIVYPVCEAINAQPPSTSKIITIEPGVAQLIGNYWQIDKNNKIRIEYNT